MDLDVQEAADLLGVSPSTLRRWVRQGLLGLAMPSGELRFGRAELERWARRQGLSFRATRKPAARPATQTPFHGALDRGAILREVSGEAPGDVLAQMVEAAPLEEGVDREALLRQLLARESLTSTGLGHGVALPHPRTPSADFAGEPRVVLALLAQPVDWQAVDGEAVHSVLLLLSPSPTEHLQVLSRAAFLLRDPSFCELLATRSSDDAILARILELEPRPA